MIAELSNQYKNINFLPGDNFIWSPDRQTIFYHPERLANNEGKLALLHEIAHSELNHQTYTLDIELINMEVSAWSKARQLAAHFLVDVNNEHIEQCLETYRLWLYKRSRCPNCQNTGLQQDGRTYRCFICSATWKVADSQSLRPRRMRCIVP